MLIKNISHDGQSQRSSLAWDKNKQPKKGILKHKSKTIKNSNIQQPLIIRLPSNDDNSNIEDNNDNSNNQQSYYNIIKPKTKNDSNDIQDLMNKLSINQQSNITQHQTYYYTKINAGKLYRKFDDSTSYDNSTSFTIRYGLNKQRIQNLRNNQTLINILDIFDISTMLNELINFYNKYCQTITSNDNTDDVTSFNNISNDFYCNTYWTISFLETIVKLVFDKMNIKHDDDIMFNSQRIFFKECDNIEHTHILKEQLSVCEWIITTIGPNYEKDDIPYQLGSLLIREIKKIFYIINTENNKWITYAINLLC